MEDQGKIPIKLLTRIYLKMNFKIIQDLKMMSQNRIRKLNKLKRKWMKLNKVN